VEHAKFESYMMPSEDKSQNSVCYDLDIVLQ